MKKNLILALFALISVASYSQISWNVKAGMNLSNITADIDGNKSMKIGFHAGVGMEYAFTDMFSLRPSLMLTTKGVKYERSVKNLTLKASINEMYLEMPIMGAASFSVAEGQKVVVKAGPYLAYGIGGKIKVGDVSFDTFNEDVHKFDAGVAVGAAYEINKFFIDVTSEFGLTNLPKDSDVNNKNVNVSIGVGYKF